MLHWRTPRVRQARTTVRRGRTHDPQERSDGTIEGNSVHWDVDPSRPAWRLRYAQRKRHAAHRDHGPLRGHRALEPVRFHDRFHAPGLAGGKPGDLAGD